MVSEIFNSWRNYFSEKSNLYRFTITFFLFFFCTFFFKEYLILVESWEHSLGVFDDPFFLKQPIDLSIPIFIFTYGTILFFVFYHLNNPHKLVVLICALVLRL